MGDTQTHRPVQNNLLKVYACAAFLYATSTVNAQPYPEVELDIMAGATLQPVPFDEFFIIKGQISDLSKVEFVYRPDLANFAKDIVFKGSQNDRGEYRILFNRLLPGTQNKYNFRLRYERLVSPADVERLRKEFVTNVSDYLIRDEFFVANSRTISNSTIRSFQTQLQNSIPKNLSDKSILVASGSLLDDKSNVLAGSKILATDLVGNVRQRRNEINDLIEEIDGQPANGIMSLVDLAAALFTDARLKKLKASKNEDVAAAATLIQSAPDDAINCLITGGLFAENALPKDCGKDGFESRDLAVLTRKATNFSRYLSFLAAVKADLLTNKDKTGITIVDLLRNRLSTLPDRSMRIKNLLEEREILLNQLSQAISVAIVRDITITGFNDGTLVTRSQWYVSMDAGLLYAPTIDQLVPYIGANIYFRPVKKNTSFARLREDGRKLFPYRFAAVIGFTPTNLSQDTRFRTDVVGGRAGLIGAGYRLTEFLRIGGGTLIVRQKDLNPLVSQYRLRLTPFISISADIDVAALFRPQFK